jgi:hypothetical protein
VRNAFSDTADAIRSQQRRRSFFKYVTGLTAVVTTERWWTSIDRNAVRTCNDAFGPNVSATLDDAEKAAGGEILGVLRKLLRSKPALPLSVLQLTEARPAGNGEAAVLSLLRHLADLDPKAQAHTIRVLLGVASLLDDPAVLRILDHITRLHPTARQALISDGGALFAEIAHAWASRRDWDDVIRYLQEKAGDVACKQRVIARLNDACIPLKSR